eukprot:g6254.t1
MVVASATKLARLFGQQRCGNSNECNGINHIYAHEFRPGGRLLLWGCCSGCRSLTAFCSQTSLPDRSAPTKTVEELRQAVAAILAGIETGKLTRYMEAQGIKPLQAGQHTYALQLLFPVLFRVFHGGIDLARQVLERRRGVASHRNAIVMTDGFYAIRGNARGTGQSPHICAPLMDVPQQFIIVFAAASKGDYTNPLFPAIGDNSWVADGSFKVESYMDTDGKERVSRISTKNIVLEFGSTLR